MERTESSKQVVLGKHWACGRTVAADPADPPRMVSRPSFLDQSNQNLLGGVPKIRDIFSGGPCNKD